MHAAKALEYPRWEDFNYEQLDKVQSRFYWLGDGNAVADRDPKADSELSTIERISFSFNLFPGAWYLKPENIDYPPA